jgi:ParB-like chromosome segregation protein Spo0J
MQNLKEQKPKLIDVSKLQLNESNPRTIKDVNFEKLKRSLKEFPKMLELRPIICNDQMIVLGGNMRLRAAIDLGFTKVPVLIANDLTEEEQKELIIKDNVGYGEWDWDMLADQWDIESLEDWGLNVPKLNTDEIDPEEQNGYDQQLAWFINIRCNNEEQANELYEKFIEDGYDVKIIN